MRNADAGRFIANLEAFQANNMLGTHYAMGTGYLPNHYRAQFHTLNHANLIDYVVYSYQTPMAWHTVNGQWIMPDTKYSVTTSKHQAIIRRAIES